MSERPRKFLEHDVRTRMELIRDIAVGGKTQKALCEKYGCSAGGLHAFKTRHKDTIAEVKANLDDKLAGLWIANKEKRIAAYQSTVEIADSEIAETLAGRVVVKTEFGEDDEELHTVASVSADVARWERTRHRALRSVAEELGQLPSRVVVSTDEGAKVRHIVENVDLSKVMGLGNPNAANDQ